MTDNKIFDEMNLPIANSDEEDVAILNFWIKILHTLT
jgi:hypothetical protein